MNICFSHHTHTCITGHDNYTIKKSTSQRHCHRREHEILVGLFSELDFLVELIQCNGIAPSLVRPPWHYVITVAIYRQAGLELLLGLCSHCHISPSLHCARHFIVVFLCTHRYDLASLVGYSSFSLHCRVYSWLWAMSFGF